MVQLIRDLDSATYLNIYGAVEQTLTERERERLVSDYVTCFTSDLHAVVEHLADVLLQLQYQPGQDFDESMMGILIKDGLNYVQIIIAL